MMIHDKRRCELDQNGNLTNKLIILFIIYYLSFIIYYLLYSTILLVFKKWSYKIEKDKKKYYKIILVFRL